MKRLVVLAIALFGCGESSSEGSTSDPQGGVGGGATSSSVGGTTASSGGQSAGGGGAGGEPYTGPTEWFDEPAGTDHPLIAISGSGPLDAWAVGEDVVVHWDGTSWKPVEAPPGKLTNVWVAGPGDVWITASGPPGRLYRGGLGGFTETVLDTGGAYAIRGTSPSNVWMGDGGDTDGFYVGLQFYDGSAWSRLQQPLDETVFSLATHGPGDGWIVTGQFEGNNAQLHRVQGTAVQAVGVGAEITYVHAIDESNVWAVGKGGKVIRYDGTAWEEHDVIGFSGIGSSVSAWGSGPADVYLTSSNYVYHYDGQTWAQLLKGNHYFGGAAVWGSGPADVWVPSRDEPVIYHLAPASGP